MTESRIVDRLRSKVTEHESYQPFIVLVPDRDTVRAAGIAGEIVLIALTRRVCDAYGTRRELVRINLVDRMVDGRSKGKRRQHGAELNDENAITGSGKIVCACGGAGTERVCYAWARRLVYAATGGCPTRRTKQRNRQGEKREYTSTHGWVSLCVSLCESRGDRQARTRSVLIISILRNLSTHNLRTSSTFWDDSGAACFPRQEGWSSPGDAEGNFIALNAATGKALWQFQCDASVYSSPMSFAIDGKQYMAVAAGSAGFTVALYCTWGGPTG